MNSVRPESGRQCHGITIKVYESKKDKLFGEFPIEKGPLNTVSTVVAENKKSFVRTLNPENKINIKGSNILGTAYTNVSTTKFKKNPNKVYVSNFHWQSSQKRGKSYGPTPVRDFNDSNMETTLQNKSSIRRIENLSHQINMLDHNEGDVVEPHNTNLPGLNKNLFISDNNELS